MPVTYALIVINCIIYALNYYVFSSDGFLLIFGLNMMFFGGALWQPLSTMFVHGSLAHLAMNMVVLFQFGTLIERGIGALRFSILYIVGGVITSLLSLSYVFYDELVNMVGASGAISVLLGFLAYYDRASGKGLLIALVLMSFAPLLMGVQIAWHAHLFGFGVGFSLAFLRKRYGVF